MKMGVTRFTHRLLGVQVFVEKLEVRIIVVTDFEHEGAGVCGVGVMKHCGKMALVNAPETTTKTTTKSGVKVIQQENTVRECT